MKKRLFVIIGAAVVVIAAVTSVVLMNKNKSNTKKEPVTSVFENFVTVDNTKLMDGDKELKFISLNYPQATSDNEWEHANAMKTIHAMGGNVTRTYTIPVYNGKNEDRAYVKGVDEDGNLIFNDDALNELDDLLAKCNQYGVRVVIPLVDHWHWVGGIDGYVWLAGESEGEPTNSSFQDWAWKFYSSEKCLDYFEQMINHLLNRVNTVTGVKYMDDKAILCWETANEAGSNQTSQRTHDDELSAWTINVVNYIKSIDTNHLVLDGRMSMTEQSMSSDNPSDILGAHYYEGNYATRCADDTVSAHEAGKPFILGEFGAKVTAEPCIEVFQAGVENETNGIMMWSLRAHKDGFGFYFHDEDGYWASYHWPGFEAGNYYGETEILRAIYAYAQIVNGNAANYEEARNIPIPAPETDEAPLLYEESFNESSVGDIKWRGVVGGAWYEIERAEGEVSEKKADSVEWTTVADASDYVYDSGRNWEDKAHDCIKGFHDETAIDGKTYSYRLRAANESGVGLWSNIVTVKNVKHVVIDPLDLIAVSSNDNNPTEIRNTYSCDHSQNIEYSSSSVVNKSDRDGYIEYKSIIPIDKIKASTLAEAESGYEPTVYVSEDGIVYNKLEIEHTAGTVIYGAENVSADTNYYYTRVYIPGESACKLDDVAIEYKNDGSAYAPMRNGAAVSTNVIIQDNTFGENGADPFYVYKENGTIIYKTGDDINAFRVITLAKNGKEPVVEYSFDGVVFDEAKVLSTKKEGEYTKSVYGDLAITDMVRVLRITDTDNDGEDVVIYSVELSSGTKSIPLADTTPDNSLEDGEFYFGQSKALEEAYKVNADAQNGVISFEKQLPGNDFSEYDSVYIYLKGDITANKLELSFTDANDAVWNSPEIALSSADGAMQKIALSDFKSSASNMDLSKVKSFKFAVKADTKASLAEGKLRLDEAGAYTGNYGVAVDYSFEEGVSNTFYVDCIYMNSSTKVDDFEGYSGSANLLNAAYSRNTNGGIFDITMDSTHKREGSYGMRIDYDYDGAGYAGATKTMDLLNLAGYDGFMMYIESDGSGNDIKLQIETDISTFSYTGFMTGTGPTIFYMPFSSIKEEAWAGSGHEIDSTNNLKSVSIYTDLIGTVSKGTFYVDDIKGANFVKDLEKLTKVTCSLENGTVFNELPCTISGTAEYVEYVSVTVGDKMFNIPVNEDGTWELMITPDMGIYNGTDIAVKAGYYYPNGDAITETAEKKFTLNAQGNDAPYVETYDNVVWSYDFGEKGTEGWTFKGFDPWLEDGNLVAWSQEEFDAVFSYTVTGLENGVYTLSNDLKVKSNMNNVQIALKSGDTEEKSLPFDTMDVMLEDQFLGKKINVTDNKVTILYYVQAPTDANGATFAVGDIKLYLVK